MSTIQALLLGLLQGVTELFPISSLGHTVIVPSLLRLDIDQSAPTFLLFIVATHAATAFVLFLFYWNDWYLIITGMIRSLRERTIEDSNTHAKLGWLLVVGTVPAGLIGLLFQDTLKTLFATPLYASFFLICNGFLLLGAEQLRRRSRSQPTGHDLDRRLARLSWMQSIKIGTMQCLALLPGFSRTGSTLAGGLLLGLSHEDAARFSFLLATPIIAAAAFLKLPELISPEISTHDITVIAIGSLASALGAYISVRYLTKYFKTQTLTPFGYYCLVAGTFALFMVNVF